MPVARGKVVRIVFEIRREEPDMRKPLEGVEEHLVPLGRRIHDVVVELDQVRSAREPERRRVCVLADVLGVQDDADAWLVERAEILGGSVGRGVVPDHDLRGRGRRPKEDVVDALLEQVDAIVRQYDDRDRVGLRSRRRHHREGRCIHRRHRRNRAADGLRPSG